MAFTRRILARWSGFTGAIALTALAVLAPPARGDVPTARDYVGRWLYMDGEEGRQQIARAVDRAVDGLPFFLEPIAEDRVGRRAGPFTELRFALEGDRLTFSADHFGPVTSRLGGPAVTVTEPMGSEVSMTQRMSRGRLVQVFEHADGTRRNTFALSGDRGTLWLSVSLSSPQLPDDADFRLRYRRASPDRRQAGR